MSILNSGFLQKISDFTKRWDSGKAFNARTTTGYSTTLKTGKYNYCVFQVTGSHAGLNLEVRGGLETEIGYVPYRSIDGVKKSGGISENGTYIIDLTEHTDLRWRVQAITSGDVTVTYNLKDHLPFYLLEEIREKSVGKSGKAFDAMTSTMDSDTYNVTGFNYCIFELSGSHAGLNIEYRGGFENVSGYLNSLDVYTFSPPSSGGENGVYIVDLSRVTQFKWRIQALTSGDVTIEYNFLNNIPLSYYQTLLNSQKPVDTKYYYNEDPIPAGTEIKILETDYKTVIDDFQIMSPIYNGTGGFEIRFITYDKEGAANAFAFFKFAGSFGGGVDNILVNTSWTSVEDEALTHNPRFKNIEFENGNILSLLKAWEFPHGVRIDFRNSAPKELTAMINLVSHHYG